MKKLIAYTKASAAFLRSALGPRDPVVQTDSHGMSRLQGWDRIPEVTAQAVAATSRSYPQGYKAILYCFEGLHQGEHFPLVEGLTRIGQNASDTLVLTPAVGNEPSHYELLVGSGFELRSEAPHSFDVNGRKHFHCSLVDYDEVVLSGNRFLFLQCQEERT